MASDDPNDPRAGELSAVQARLDHERQRAIAYLRATFPIPPACPMGHEESAWDVTEPVQLSPMGGSILASRGYPVFQVVCTRCGYTMFFNATIAGVIDPAPGESTPDP